MKKLNLFIGLLIIILACEKEKNENLNNSFKIDEFISENYTEDAKQLLFREIISDSNHVDFNNPEFNSQEIEDILKIIQAVYNLDSPEKDTVFNIYEIHAFPHYSFNSILLLVDPNAEEIINMINGTLPTGNNKLDSLPSPSTSILTIRASYSSD